MAEMAWTRGVVAIVRAGKPVGAGFVVSDDGLILTCAHVLDDAGWPYEDWHAPVMIHFAGTSHSAQARVLAQNFRSRIEDDIAFLKVDGSLPEGVLSLPVAPAQGVVGHAVYAWGYPAGFKGLRGEGVVLGQVPAGKRSQLQLRSQEMTKGYSGGPVWDGAWRRVIAMISTGLTGDNLGRLSFTTLATPAETLLDIGDGLFEPALPDRLYPLTTDTQIIMDELALMRRSLAAGDIFKERLLDLKEQRDQIETFMPLFDRKAFYRAKANPYELSTGWDEDPTVLLNAVVNARVSLGEGGARYVKNATAQKLFRELYDNLLAVEDRVSQKFPAVAELARALREKKVSNDDRYQLFETWTADGRLPEGSLFEAYASLREWNPEATYLALEKLNEELDHLATEIDKIWIKLT